MIGGIAPIGLGTFPGNFGVTQQGASSAPTGAVADSFAAALKDVASRTVGSLQQAEHMSVEALKGKADMREVVDAVMSAEQSLQAAVAIRDKIVAAYLEVSRMGI